MHFRDEEFAGKIQGLFFGGIGGAIVVFIFAICVVKSLDDQREAIQEQQDALKSEAIERGFAEHDRVTGEWQWIDSEASDG